jgi:CRISPR/Cas system-associated exonuclease Cas4 (RecB family)
MSTIRASEIGTYLYCNRAWYYQRKGYLSENQEDLAAGLQIHQNHTQMVMKSGCLRFVAYSFLISAIVIMAIYFTTIFI